MTNNPLNNPILGVGWAFPPEASGAGDIATTAYEKDVREAIGIILGTSPGERVMRPDFGAGLNALVFAPINTTTMALASYHVQKALVQWEPRIDQVTVNVVADPPNGRLNIDIRYRIRSINTFYNLVYPFYLKEGNVS
jgi:phage baseplate assembly protein W